MSSIHRPGADTALDSCRSFLRSAQGVQSDLFRSWTSTPVASLDARVPSQMAAVDAGIMALRNRFLELQMLTSPSVISAAEDLLEAARAASTAQFEIHVRSHGSTRHLAGLDNEAFTRHTQRVDSALTEFSRAVGRQTVATAGPDRDKMARVSQAIPSAATWVTFLRSQQPLHRIPTEVTEGVEQARDVLRSDIIDFTDPGLARLHQDLVDALDLLADELAGTFTPDDSDTLSYTEVPPEWKRTDPNRYYKTLNDLSHARHAVLDAYKKLMNTMSSHLPEPDAQGPSAGPSFHFNTGDNSPVSLNAPYAHASGSATASAGTSPPSPAAAGAPWYRSSVFWTGLSALATLAAAVIAYFALIK